MGFNSEIKNQKTRVGDTSQRDTTGQVVIFQVQLDYDDKWQRKPSCSPKQRSATVLFKFP